MVILFLDLDRHPEKYINEPSHQSYYARGLISRLAKYVSTLK
jgi:hypothetical protein